jgi:hypothetical protein
LICGEQYHSHRRLENDLDVLLTRRVLTGDVTVDLTTDSLPLVQAAE